MRYLLDTDICIYAAKRKPPQVETRLRRLQPGDIGMSIVTYCELVYGAFKSQASEANLGKIEQLCHLVPVLPLEMDAAGNFGRIRSELEEAGTPIGAYDLMIGAHALSLGLILVTNNVREFSRVKGLRLENWAA